jgi:DNA-binding IclR family transcriptional regulator
MTEMDKKSNGALGKALAILEAIAEDARPIAVPDIVDATGLPRQTVHRVLKQLEELGLVDRDPIRERFSPGERLAHLGMRSISARLSRGPAHKILVDIVNQIGETCNIGMMESNEVVYIDRVECDWPLRVQFHPGSRVPVHCTAIGKLLLAHMDEEARREVLSIAKLTRYTKHTMTDRRELEAHFELIRQQGYAVNDQEDAIGLVAVAVPIRNAEGEVVAGLAVHAPIPRFTVDDATKRLPLFNDAAIRIADAIFEPNPKANSIAAE